MYFLPSPLKIGISLSITHAVSGSFGFLISHVTVPSADVLIFVQLAEVWDNMEDVSQSRVAEILGGTRNTSGIMSTITNIKDAIGAYASAMDSAGTATEANNIYMDTTKAKVGELKAAFQELSSDVFDSDFTKGAVDALRGIVEAIDKVISTFGSLKTILVGLGIAKIIKNVA